MSAAAAGFDHSAWNRVLQAQVNELGEVDYAAIKSNPKDLNAYIQQLAEVSPESKPDRFTKAGALAYWMNAYNAFTTKGVVEAYPTKSVRDLGVLYGFFRRKDYTAGGRKISLRSLENDIIRKLGDPRIHFAIVCASISCPRLPREAFTEANLEKSLDRAARTFLNERRNVTIDAARNEVTVNPILTWYKEDYGASGSREKVARELLAYVRKYANAETAKLLDRLKEPKLSVYDYDWAINDPGSRARAKSPLERELARMK